MANRVVVLLSDEEMASVRERAGLVPLSAWFRALALSGKKVSRASDALPSSGSVNRPRRELRPKGDKTR